MNERIKEVRKALGLSQEQFAYGLKVSAADIADFESGKCLPSGRLDPSHLWLVDKVAGFSDQKVDLLADIATAMI